MISIKNSIRPIDIVLDCKNYCAAENSAQRSTVAQILSNSPSFLDIFKTVQNICQIVLWEKFRHEIAKFFQLPALSLEIRFIVLYYIVI